MHLRRLHLFSSFTIDIELSSTLIITITITRIRVIVYHLVISNVIARCCPQAPPTKCM